MRKLAKGLRVEQNEIFSFAGFKDMDLMPGNITESKHADIVRIPVLKASDLLGEDEDLQSQSYELVDSNTIDLNFSYYWISVTQTDLLADHIMPGDLALIKETDSFNNDQICLVRIKHDVLYLRMSVGKAQQFY
mgnify:CR=1 FL=1